jgi:hypothetical protein
MESKRFGTSPSFSKRPLFRFDSSFEWIRSKNSNSRQLLLEWQAMQFITPIVKAMMEAKSTYYRRSEDLITTRLCRTNSSTVRKEDGIEILGPVATARTMNKGIAVIQKKIGSKIKLSGRDLVAIGHNTSLSTNMKNSTSCHTICSRQVLHLKQ